MLNKLLVIIAVLVSLLLQGCNSVISQTSNTEIKTEISQPPEVEISTQQKVEFKGVSFTYNPQIFGKVKSEEVAEYPLEQADFKPDGVEPQHRLFTFDLATGFSKMSVAVYPINDFPRMYDVNKKWKNQMEEEIRNLQKVLEDKNFRVENEIPYLPFIDAGQAFQVKVKHFNFSGGKGILFLTFWDTEIELPSNRQLRYIFEGLTDDGKYYVLAEMPVSVAFLPEDSSEEYEGYKIPWGEKFDYENVVSKQIAEVNKKVARRLDNLPENEFKPNPKYLEEIISSLKIEK